MVEFISSAPHYGNGMRTGINYVGASYMETEPKKTLIEPLFVTLRSGMQIALELFAKI